MHARHGAWDPPYALRAVSRRSDAYFRSERTADERSTICNVRDNRKRAMADSIRLDGKVAIVTGGGRGLGRAMALALAEAGARVVAVDLIAENLARVEREAASLAGGDALTGVAADIRKAEDCRRAIAAAHERCGGLDILVNNAGLLPSYAYPGR